MQTHLEQVFRTLRTQWGIHYFKLDANFWGHPRWSLPRPRRHPGGGLSARHGRHPARRRGGAFLLGCNAPLWPSLGLVHGMRVSDDVERQGPRFRQIAREAFCRAWQHERLWVLDPDCVCLRDIPGQHGSRAEYDFHLAALVASGGMVLAGTDCRIWTRRKGRVLASCSPCAPRAPRRPASRGWHSSAGGWRCRGAASCSACSTGEHPWSSRWRRGHGLLGRDALGAPWCCKGAGAVIRYP